MQNTQSRCLILIAVLAVGTGLLAAINEAQPARAGRWPTEDALYAVDNWTVSPAAVESRHGVHFVSRRYARADGMAATLVVAASPEAKRIYRAGVDVPFLGSGYTADPAPPSLVPPAPGRGALLVSGKNEVWLLLYAYGERRGLLGNGVLGWGLAALDGVLGQPNDYFLPRLLVPLERLDSAVVQEAALLADTLFPRLVSWYAD